MLEVSDRRALAISVYFAEMLKYQDIWGIISMFKELYCFSEPSVDVLMVELRYVIGS
jgi:hypothetical protein